MSTASNKPGRPRAWRQLAFPALLHVWPLLLLVSQKALVPVGLVLLRLRHATSRRDLLAAGLMLAGTGLLLAVQPPNEFDVAHYLGYALFVLSVPLVNAAIIENRQRLVLWLAVLSVVNALMAFAVYLLEVDLSALRGLNRIIGDDGSTHRVYFETTSLVAIFSVKAVPQRVLRWLMTLVVLLYAVLLARSVFVLLLFLVNQSAPYLVRARARELLLWIPLAAVVAAAGFFAVVALRPDMLLSVGIKLLQLSVIAEQLGNPVLGAGWGFVIDEIINSIDQPYQVEMQLPMLVLQIGLLGLAVHLVGMFRMLGRISRTRRVQVLRTLTYFSIGLVNPWMLIPSWYLTVALMYDDIDRRTP